MDTLARPADNPPDPQAATPYYFREAVDAEAARRGLTPEPWAA
jgi:hypothetical protein